MLVPRFPGKKGGLTAERTLIQLLSDQHAPNDALKQRQKQKQKKWHACNVSLKTQTHGSNLVRIIRNGIGKKTEEIACDALTKVANSIHKAVGDTTGEVRPTMLTALLATTESENAIVHWNSPGFER
eukprot:6464487-Amphidinium_carterae.1